MLRFPRRRPRPRTCPAEPGLPALLRKTPAEIGALLAGDPVQAAIWVQAAARAGLGAAQLRLGRMLLEGAGLPKDEAAAWRWFSTAARDGDAEAMNMVGRCHENGWGVQQDPSQAAIWYRRAADRGEPWAQYNLAHLLLDGNGVARDCDAAFAWYQRAAAQGHARAMNLLAVCYENGWGTPRAPVLAASWYQRSAAAGYFRGEYNYATLLMAAGKMTEARYWFERAAAHGTPAVKDKVRQALLHEKSSKHICAGAGLQPSRSSPRQPLVSL